MIRGSCECSCYGPATLLARSCYSPVTLLLISCYYTAILLLLSLQSPATLLTLSCQCPVTVLRLSCESPGTLLVLSWCPLACKNSNHRNIPAQGPNNGERNRVPPPLQDRTLEGVFKQLCTNHPAAVAFSQLFVKTISTTACKQASSILSCYNPANHLVLSQYFPAVHLLFSLYSHITSPPLAYYAHVILLQLCC